MNKTERINELVKKLNEAAKAYYQDASEIMSNYEYDALYDELTALEQETGIVLASSPTVRVGYEVLSELPKERHEKPMLSLDKTKEVEELREWVGSHKSMLSWKLDGLTIVLTYENGQLAKAVTRGNGEIGEVITNNAKVFRNIPLSIAYQGTLVLRGEAVIPYSEFYRINETIPDADAKYKNPRNLCSGSVRQLNNEITAKRNVNFFAFSLVKAEGVDFENSHEKQMLWLKGQGFDIVEYEMVTADTLEKSVSRFAERIEKNDFPSDGLVVVYDDIAYGESLGRTAKFPRNSIAFKWADEIRETTLREIEWSPSRTGLINPVAIFDPVELEGTTVSRASVHNISVMEGLELGIGDIVEVYKANMIIPQIAENKTRSGMVAVPQHCPVCGGDTQVRQIADARALYCTNPDCQAKKIKSFTLFVSRDAMNMEGLSEATLEKMIARGFIHEFADIFRLSRYRKEICEMEGFGEKSCSNLLASVEKARRTTLPRLIYGLGIQNIGAANAKLLAKEYHYDIEAIRSASVEELAAIDGIGEVIASSITEYFQKEKNRKILENLLSEVILEKPAENVQTQIFEGMNFCITGSVEHFANRNEVKAVIEERGGKVTGTVTGKTNYLINNDKASNSSKNKKAKELNIPIISEEDFLAMLG